PIVATGVKLHLNWTELGSLGTYEAIFTGSKQGAKECWSEQASPATKDGQIVASGEIHLVDFGKTEATLELGAVFLVTGLTILCGKPNELKGELKITVKGGAVAKIEGVKKDM